MPASHVLAPHDDGRWYLAQLLQQHKQDGRWRAVVVYTVAPGFTFQRGYWADELRPATDQEHDQPGDRGRGHRDTDGQDDPPEQVAWVVRHGRRS